MYNWFLLLIVSAFCGLSIYVRIVNYRSSKAASTIDGFEVKNSPFSTAVQELIATAGGIYLSLIMLVSFLKIEIPEKMSLGIISLDPLAFTSIGLAIIQPFIISIFFKE